MVFLFLGPALVICGVLEVLAEECKELSKGDPVVTANSVRLEDEFVGGGVVEDAYLYVCIFLLWDIGDVVCGVVEDGVPCGGGALSLLEGPVHVEGGGETGEESHFDILFGAEEGVQVEVSREEYTWPVGNSIIVGEGKVGFAVFPDFSPGHDSAGASGGCLRGNVGGSGGSSSRSHDLRSRWSFCSCFKLCVSNEFVIFRNKVVGLRASARALVVRQKKTYFLRGELSARNARAPEKFYFHFFICVARVARGRAVTHFSLARGTRA